MFKSIPDEADVCPDCAAEMLKPFLRQGYGVKLLPPEVYTFTITGIKQPGPGQ